MSMLSERDAADIISRMSTDASALPDLKTLLVQLLNEARCLSKETVGNKELAERIVRLLKERIESLQPPNPTGCICVEAYDSQGRVVVTGSRSSEHPARDHHIGEAAIEFFYAVQRGVDITPEVLWKHVMGKEYVAP